MVMLVSSRIDLARFLIISLAMVGLAGSATFEAMAQGPRPPAQKPAAKPPSGKPLGPKAAAAAQQAKLDAAGPSQIGTSTVARFAYMMDAQTGAVILSKDADTAMAPSS